MFSLAMLSAGGQAELFDRGGGMIYDDVLEITWLQNANAGAGSAFDDGSNTTDGWMSFDNAVAWVDDLSFGGFEDWRLPSMDVNGDHMATGDFDNGIVDCSTASEMDCRDNELGYMYYHNLMGNPGDDLTATQGPFMNIQIFHWSGTEWEFAPGIGVAWFLLFVNGDQDIGTKGCCPSPWAVRDGDVGPQPSVIYSQDFEMPGIPDVVNGLIGDDWLFFNNIFNDGDFLFSYFGPAPNGPQISAIATGEGGPLQGDQVLVVYSDYDCCPPPVFPPGSPATGHQAMTAVDRVEANVFKERTITADDVGTVWTFSFDAKKGNINDPSGTSVANAFLKVLDSVGGSFAVIAEDTLETTSISSDWARYSVELTIGDWVGQLVQFGFKTNSGNFEPSGVFYDNVEVSSLPASDSDADGVADVIDNCTTVANAGQQDTDADLIGDRCDGDYTNDCVVNFADIALFAPEFLGSNPLFDHDSSGAVNFADYAILTSYFLQPPGPSAAGCN